MSHQDLITRYRNLLVVLARCHTAMVEGSQAIRTAANMEILPGRKSGLYCKANAMAKHAKTLGDVVRKNKSAMKHFFNSSDLGVVARQEINYNEFQLTPPVTALPFRQHEHTASNSNQTNQSRPARAAKALPGRR